MPRDPLRQLREDLVELLSGGGAHLDFDDAVAGLPKEWRGTRAEPMPHTAWRLVEHMRLCQHDILHYTTDADWASPPWPDGFWPEGDAPPSESAWDESLQGFRADLEAMIELVRDPKTELLMPLPWGEADHTVAREAMLIADHNSYHIGQLIALRRLLNAWD